MSAESSPKIVIVDESPIRAAILEEGLREAGFTRVVHDGGDGAAGLRPMRL